MSITVHPNGHLVLGEALDPAVAEDTFLLACAAATIIPISARAMEIPADAVEAGLDADLTLREIALELDRDPDELASALHEALAPRSSGGEAALIAAGAQAVLDRRLRSERL